MTRVIPFGKPMIDEREKRAVAKVLEGDTLVHGPLSHEFEKAFAAFTGAPHAVSASSATAALHLAYIHLGVGPGDEVIVPAQTHVATAHAVEICGARPVFVDAELRTGNIDIDRIEAAITPRTKAISVVHYLGVPVDMGRVCDIARRRGLFIVEDCALALGSRLKGTHMGLWGDVGCFSFYPAKHITTGEGGMLITKHADVAKRIALLKAFGVDKAPQDRKVPGVYDVVEKGINYRMGEIASAMGVHQMAKIGGFLERRGANFRALRDALQGIKGLSHFESGGSEYVNSYYCMSVILDQAIAEKRPQLQAYLKEKGIGTSVYYPQAIPNFTYYQQKYRHPRDAFPVAALISRASLALPVGPHLNEEDMKYIAVNLAAGLKAV